MKRQQNIAKGFTLIEILIAVVVTSAVGALVLPVVGMARRSL